MVSDPRGRRAWLSQPSLCACTAQAHLQALRTSVSLPFKASTCLEWRFLGTLLALVTPWTRCVLGMGKVVVLILQEEIPCRAWGRAGRPRSAFLKPLLGQIHPLDQSKLGPIPAVRLGTGFASLLQGVGALVPSWQEGAGRAKHRRGPLGNGEFPGVVQTEAGCGVWRDLSIGWHSGSLALRLPA